MSNYPEPENAKGIIGTQLQERPKQIREHPDAPSSLAGTQERRPELAEIIHMQRRKLEETWELIQALRERLKVVLRPAEPKAESPTRPPEMVVRTHAGQLLTENLQMSQECMATLSDILQRLEV
jgi:hypothetical protein